MSIFRRNAAAEPDLPWSGRMVLTVTGSGPKVDYPNSCYSSSKLLWVSRESSDDGSPLQSRTPSEHSTVFNYAGGFKAAGRSYSALEQLFVEHDDTKTFCRDCYGREVLYLAERFPCFDSYDYANETRFYRWFFLRQNDRLTRIHYTDETNKIYVTEDVLYLESGLWSQMCRYGYFNAEER